MILGQPIPQAFKRFFRRIAERKQLRIIRGNGACVSERFKVEYAAPVLFPVNNYDDFLGKLLSLRKGEDFKQLVQCAKAPGKTTSALAR